MIGSNLHLLSFVLLLTLFPFLIPILTMHQLKEKGMLKTDTGKCMPAHTCARAYTPILRKQFASLHWWLDSYLYHLIKFNSHILCRYMTVLTAQVSYFKTTKLLKGAGRRLFRMAPFHHHLELCGFKEPAIVAGAYIISCGLELIAGYVGLISA